MTGNHLHIFMQAWIFKLCGVQPHGSLNFPFCQMEPRGLWDGKEEWLDNDWLMNIMSGSFLDKTALQITDADLPGTDQTAAALTGSGS